MVGCLGLEGVQAAVRGGIWTAAGGLQESVVLFCPSVAVVASHLWAQPWLASQALPQPLCVFLSQVWLASLGSAQEISMRYVCMSLLFIKQKKNQKEGIPVLLFISWWTKPFHNSTSINSYYFSHMSSEKRCGSLYICFCQGICEKTWILHADGYLKNYELLFFSF